MNSMTELIKQLVEEMKEIEPKYVAVRMGTKFNLSKLFCGNDKEKLRNRLLEHVIKEVALEKYLDVDKIRDCKTINLCLNPYRLELIRENDELETIIMPEDMNIYNNYFGIKFLKKDTVCVYTYNVWNEIRYTIIETFEK